MRGTISRIRGAAGALLSFFGLEPYGERRWARQAGHCRTVLGSHRYDGPREPDRRRPALTPELVTAWRKPRLAAYHAARLEPGRASSRMRAYLRRLARSVSRWHDAEPSYRRCRRRADLILPGV